MVRTNLFLSALLFATPLAFGQSADFHHNTLSFGGGAASPTGAATGYLNTAPLLRFNYGHRFRSWFQADAGFQMAFGAANTQSAVYTDIGQVQGHDREYMIPLGGRIVFPLPFKRVEVSAGGGAVYLHYSESAPSNPYYMVNCYTCTARGGWGGYGLGNISYFLDDNHTFRVGTTVQYISASTNGDAVGNVPALKTTDHWMNASIELGVNF